MSAGDSAPYERLAEMIQRELELAGAGDLDGLAAAQAQRAALKASLPATAPAHARAALERAALLQRNLSIELERRREAVLDAIRELELTARAAAGYTPALRRPRLLDANA
jgi:hypothetical protein